MVLPYPYYLSIYLSIYLSTFLSFFLFCLPLSIGLVCKSFDDYQKRTFNVNFVFSSIVIWYLIDTVSKRENTCDCTIFLNFGLPCRHIFLCREKQNHDIYDGGKNLSLLMTTLKFALFTSAEINKRRKAKINPKTTIDKYNKAIAVCRVFAIYSHLSLAKFSSFC